MGCRTRSKQAVHIEQEVYQNYQNKVCNDVFLCACADVLQQLKVAKAQLIECKSGSCKMVRNLFGLYVIEVKINGVSLRFVVDTGAQISGIREAAITQLSYQKAKGKVEITSIGGAKKYASGIVVEDFSFACIQYKQAPLIILDDQSFSMRFMGLDFLKIDGILGWDFLSTIDFELDDVDHKFKVIENKYKIDYPNCFVGGFPCVIVKKANLSYALFGIDTGSKHSWLGESIMKETYGVKNSQSVLGMGVNGLEKMEMKFSQAFTLYLDKASISFTGVMSGPVQIFPHFTYEGVLGNEIFAGRRIRFINSKSMILLA